MIALGNYDPTVDTRALDDYRALVKSLTDVSGGAWSNQLRDEGGWVSFTPAAGNEMSVADLQRFLKGAGFLPYGAIDGICGYRTTSAIRLFQEYVRTVEGESSIGYPDGHFGANSTTHATRWIANNMQADWATNSTAGPSAEHTAWMTLLRNVQAHLLANPDDTTTKLNAAPRCDTVHVADWDVDPVKIHLIGIRHRRSTPSPDGKQLLDDVFVLCIQGAVFKFYGSTEPGTKEQSAGQYPFLVPGQHRYRFGWHKISDMDKVFQALKPAGQGVWVVRSASLIPSDAELAGPLDGPNNSINVHWSGGITENASWSAGCQVINGRSYINHHNAALNCSAFAANAETSAEAYANLGQKIGGVYRTKGAYTVLEDLVAALSGAQRDDNVVRYTLLKEEDLALNPDIGEGRSRDILTQLKAC